MVVLTLPPFSFVCHVLCSLCAFVRVCTHICSLLKDLYKVKVFQNSLSPEEANLSEVIATEIEVRTHIRLRGIHIAEYTCQCSLPPSGHSVRGSRSLNDCTN